MSDVIKHVAIVETDVSGVHLHFQQSLLWTTRQWCSVALGHPHVPCPATENGLQMLVLYML